MIKCTDGSQMCKNFLGVQFILDDNCVISIDCLMKCSVYVDLNGEDLIYGIPRSIMCGFVFSSRSF
jgi:hypothetical protein